MSLKTCKRCGETKSLSEFNTNKRSKDGLTYHCKGCNKKSNQRYYLSNREKLLKEANDYYKENLGKVKLRSKKYYDQNKDKLLEKTREYHKQNSKELYLKRRDYFFSKVAERRGQKLNATPPWLTPDHQKEIEQFYWLARDLKSVTGEQYDVDHIVPLKGKNVCGLHVPWNLQVLPSDVNRRKSNVFT
jgi:hypothetical protein